MSHRQPPCWVDGRPVGHPPQWYTWISVGFRGGTATSQKRDARPSQQAPTPANKFAGDPGAGRGPRDVGHPASHAKATTEILTLRVRMTRVGGRGCAGPMWRSGLCGARAHVALGPTSQMTSKGAGASGGFEEFALFEFEEGVAELRSEERRVGK